MSETAPRLCSRPDRGRCVSERSGRRADRWIALAMLLVLTHVPTPADATLDGPTQPEFVPRVTTVVRPFHIYADPTLPTSETGLRDLSMPDLHRSVRDFFRRDPRYAIGDDFTTRMLAIERASDQQDLSFIADESARLGAEHYRAYNLASAISELQNAIETYERSTAPWTRPADVADAYRTLAFALLERGRVDSEVAAESYARASQAFGRLIRIDPGAVIDEALFPPTVVEVYREAYLRHFLDGGAQLRLGPEEARRLARLLDVDQLVHVFTMTDGEGARVVVQVFDRVAGRFVHDGSRAIEPTLDAARQAVLAELAIAVACQPLIPPPEVDDRGERGATYVYAGFASATWLERPTRRLFYNAGAAVGATWLLSETFGLSAGASQWVARRDPDGELIGRVDTTRVSLASTASGRLGRWRIFANAGFDVARTGSVRATDEFWCKVSEGEAFDFDGGERECEEDDIVDAAPGAHFGLLLGAGLGFEIAGPVWLHLQSGATLYIVPFDDRTLGSPLFLDFGASYRF